MVKKKLHPGAKWLFRIGGYALAAFPLIFLLSFVFSVLNTIFGINPIIVFIVLLIAILIFGEIFSRMTYDRWFYELTPSSLKIERGIIWKRYSNIPYVKIQNVDIHRGILARLLGFSTVLVQTAGYAYGPRGRFAEGNIPAVSIKEAEKIRDFLVKKASKGSRSL